MLRWEGNVYQPFRLFGSRFCTAGVENNTTLHIFSKHPYSKNLYYLPSALGGKSLKLKSNKTL